MDKDKFICLICRERFSKVVVFKQHLDSYEHAREFVQFYRESTFQAKRKITPWIFYKDYGFKPDKPILGLSQMTLCFSSETATSFYLCHLCERLETADSIVNHVYDRNHYHNYFAFTNPNALNMSDDPLTLDDFKKEQKKNGVGELQVLHLPETMLRRYSLSHQSYRKVRIWLHNYKCVANMFKERVPERVKIQTYTNDPNRKHPLVGLQYIVEAVCASPQLETNVFLCTLCCLKLDSSMIIRHLLSFDHLYNYFSDVDPTLKEKECYRNDCTLTDLAMQSKKPEGHTKIQRVYLNTRQMSAVVNASFKDALCQIETIMKNRLPSVKPGRKLGLCTSGEAASSGGEPSTSPQPHSLHCQNCNQRFDTVTCFFNHLRTSEHLENIRKNFGQAIDKATLQSRPQLPLLQHLTENYHSCVGKSLVVTIISQHDQMPVHMCFACDAVFLSDTFNLHMNSPRHIVQSLMVKNPWRLPFAWKTYLDLKYIKVQACSEEEEAGTEQRIIRVLDVPTNQFPGDFSHTFSEVMDRVKLTVNDVTQCEMLNQETERFPLLGRKYLVKYGKATNGYKFLCLLCERTLSSDAFAGHVFSNEHVFSFLGRFHPGSLDSHTTNEEVLDMAKQAALLYPISKEQEVEFEIHEASAYSTKVRLLTDAVRETGKGPLMPPMQPKKKLVPRQMKKEDCVLKSEENDMEITPPPSEKCSEKMSGGGPSVDQIASFQTKKEVPEEPVCKPPASGPTEEVPSTERRQCDSNMNARVSKTESVDLEGSPEKTLSLQTATGGRSSRDAVADSASYILWSHVQEENRPPIIGLSAVVECICQDLAPIYVCECCQLVFKEQHIAKHLCETWHYVNYLSMVGEKPLPQITTWRTALLRMADDWEKREGYGEAQTLELTPEEFNKLASISGYKEAKKILKNHEALQAKNKTDQQNVKIERNPEPCTVPMKINVSSDIETDSTLHQEMTTTLPNFLENPNTPPISLDLTLKKTETTQISISPSDLSCSESSKNPKPGSQNTPIDSSLKIEDKTLKPSKLVCKFIARGTVFENESKTTAASVEDIDNNNVPSASSTITATPNSNSTCKFMTSQSGNKNVFTPVTTCLDASSSSDGTANVKTSPCDRSVGILPNTQTTVVSAIDNSTQVNNIPPITRAADSNPAKDAPNQSVQQKADSMLPGDIVSKVAQSGSNTSVGKKTTSQIVCSIPFAAPAKSTTYASDEHTKSTGNPLKLNLKAVAEMKKDSPGSGSFSPSSPNFSSRPPTTEVSEKGTKMGYDQMLRVKCNESSHTYCFACLEIIDKTNHLTSKSHQMNCVKAKYPSWDAQLNERTLGDMVAQYAEEEKAKGRFACKDLEIPLDLYRELKNIPPAKAIEKVQYLINKGLKKPAERRLSAKASASPCDSLSASLTDVTNLDRGNEDNPTNPQEQIIAEHLIKIPRTTTSPPAQKPMSKVAPRIIKGSTSDEPSLLSRILAVMDRPVVGLRFLWECRDWRVVPPRAPTFYLCECCRETIVVGKITEHLDNFQHKSNFLMQEYERFMFWTDDDLLPEMMIELINGISDWVLCREELMDVQIVLLREECFEWVRTAPFSDALYVVQRIKQEMETTSLPRIVTQHDPQNTTSALTDNKIIHPDSASPNLFGNTSAPIAETCLSPAESTVTSSVVASPETCPAQSPAPAKQPDMLCSSVFTPHLSAPPNDDYQMPCEADIISNQIVSKMPKQISEPLVSQFPTHFSEQSQPALTIRKSTSNETLNDNFTKSIEGDHKGSSESPVVAPSSTNDNDAQSPPYQPDMFQMLLDLIKQGYPSVPLQESCGSGSSESTVQLHKPQRSKRWDVGPLSNTDTEVSPKENLTEPRTSPEKLSVMSRNNSKFLFSNEQGKRMINMESESSAKKQAQNEESMIQDLKMYVLNSQDSMESFQTRFQEAHKDDQPIDITTGAGISQNSQQTLELQMTSETQKGPKQCLTPDHMQHESLSTETVKIQHTPVKAQQSQVAEETTQDQTLQMPIYSLVPAIPQTAVQFLGDRDDRPIPVLNPNVQITQSVSEAGATRDYSNVLNMPVEHAYLYNSAYPSQLFHQLQAQQYYTFIQNAGASGISQSEGQTYAAYVNAGEAGTSNVVQLNTFGHQCYIYNYNNLQNYNRLLMQNYFHTQSYSPGSVESQSSLYRQ